MPPAICYKLKAIYEAKVETITITFDSRGGSSVDSITINKGAELTLPDAPTYKGYKFVTWEYEDKIPIEDKTKLDEDTKLYAKWEKIENKKEEKKKETPKKEPVKKEEPAKKPEESISISVSRSTIHRNEYSTSSAIASVRNANLNGVVYSLDSKCVTINSKTGAISAVQWDKNTSDSAYRKCMQSGQTITVKATLLSGKSASSNIYLEKDLVSTVGSESYNRNGEMSLRTRSFTINSNIAITSWNGICTYYDDCKYTSLINRSATSFTGTFKQIPNGQSEKSDSVKITAYTKANQHITLKIVETAM